MHQGANKSHSRGEEGQWCPKHLSAHSKEVEGKDRNKTRVATLLLRIVCEHM